MKEQFTIKQAVTITQVPRERLKEWLLRGYIRPSIAAGVGAGRSNLYSRIDLYVIALFDYLVSQRKLHRVKAGWMIRGLSAVLSSTIEKAKNSKSVFIAFIDRPMGKDKMTRKAGPSITDDGQLVGEKAIAPLVRVLVDEDLEKGFKTLFLTFDDTRLPADFDLSGLAVRDILIVDFKDLKNRIDERVE